MYFTSSSMVEFFYALVLKQKGHFIFFAANNWNFSSFSGKMLKYFLFEFA